MVFAIVICIEYFSQSSARIDKLVYFDTFYQIARDWTTEPFVDMILVDAERGCPPDIPEVVFYQNWQGLDVQCNCRPNSEK